MSTVEPVRKVERELAFYFWTGAVLYFLNMVLYAIHVQQWKGWDPVDYGSLALLFAINVGLIHKVRRMRNWARNLFLVKFVMFACFLYPYFFFSRSGGWVYSDHWPHGALQRISNYSDIAYEIFFAGYLLKRSVRFVFAHP